MFTIIIALIVTACSLKAGKHVYDKIQLGKQVQEKQLAYDNSLSVIENNDVDAIQKIVEKEVLLKAYLLVLENMKDEEENFEYKYNHNYQAKEIIFYSTKKRRFYHLVENRGLFQRGEYHHQNSGLHNEIEFGKTVEQNNFWEAFFKYVEKTVKEKEAAKELAREEKKKKEQEELETQYF